MTAVLFVAVALLYLELLLRFLRNRASRIRIDALLEQSDLDSELRQIGTRRKRRKQGQQPPEAT